jgi:hypothetical protein
MPDFQPGQTIETREAFVQVDASPEKPLPPGKMVFQLIVIDDQGTESAPVTADVYVIDNARPTAVLNAPPRVQAGQPFRLDGSGSSDVDGKVARYRWTRIA